MDCNGNRNLSYIEAIHETFLLILKERKESFILGEGVNDKVGMFGGTSGLSDFFPSRVIDIPLAETGMTGVAIGAALGGLHPIFCHNRPDFLMLCMDGLVNHAVKYHYMSGGECSVPMIIWAVTGQGWGAAAQHSQSVHGIFMHIPGLKIIMPTTPYDVKGMLLSAVEDMNPVLFLDHRKLHVIEGNVPLESYRVDFGTGKVRKAGDDITIVAISAGVPLAIEAANEMKKEGVSCEVIDLRSIIPWDKRIVIDSVKKTGRLLVVDTAYRTAGVASEICAEIQELAFAWLRGPVKRVTWPDTPAPASYVLEEKYYLSQEKIVEAIKTMLNNA